MLCGHNTSQGHLRSPGKKVKQKNLGFRAAIHVFRSDFRKERENDPKTLFEASKSVKNRKITVKSRNEVIKYLFLHVLCHISAIFEASDLKFCTYINEILSSNMFYGF